MSEYLSKEEIKHWRSSLERITLEEYARRLGKTLKGEKQTNDIVDIVLQNQNSGSKYISDVKKETPKETVIEIAKKSIDMEQNKTYREVSTKDKTRRLNFNKPLTEREQKVLDYFIQNTDTIVYAKDLAKVLNLPTDYVYKYIKNLRAKIIEDVLVNATKGGYRLTI
ncbi:TPA: helix-turn-helix domain-containing protein [Candidatus Galligastranaerophilus intestinigallinarum]|nr:helix-turn-helix domain-containing protein [Candidatus Galligastranaerophilus intestinigallinarum]